MTKIYLRAKLFKKLNSFNVFFIIFFSKKIFTKLWLSILIDVEKAWNLLENLSRDSVGFVCQAAYIAMGALFMQRNTFECPEVITFLLQ